MDVALFRSSNLDAASVGRLSGVTSPGVLGFSSSQGLAVGLQGLKLVE